MKDGQLATAMVLALLSAIVAWGGSNSRRLEPGSKKGVGMATQRAMDEADIRRRVNELVEAIRAMDLESVTAICAPNLVSYDVGPVLRQTGAEAKRKNWVQAFAMFQSPLGYEIRDLEITVGDEVAFGHSVNRLSGTIKKAEVGCLGSMDGVLSENRWQLAHGPRPCLGASRSGKWKSVAESRTLTVMAGCGRGSPASSRWTGSSLSWRLRSGDCRLYLSGGRRPRMGDSDSRVSDSRSVALGNPEMPATRTDVSTQL